MKEQVDARAGRAASARVLALVEGLETVRVSELHCKALKSPESDSLTLLTQIQVTAKLNGTDLATLSHYRVFAIDEDDAEEPTDENTVWRVETTLVAHWTLSSPDVTAHDAQCFAIGQGALACHPYAREVVQSATSRMNYPPATIDLIFNPWHGDDPVTIDVPE